MRCDFCKSEKLDLSYIVPGSIYNAEIYVCSNCGLTQSCFLDEFQKKERKVLTSSGANWGNIRHGKGLRLKPSLNILQHYVPFDKIDKALDIGSNRGDFVKWLYSQYPTIKMDAIEPDNNIVDNYKELNNLRLFIGRFENVEFLNNCYDIIYCSHTLEHAASASEMINKIYAIMKDESFCFIEIPNIEQIGTVDNVEEFFIDKHKYHFHRGVLREYLKYTGFDIVYENESSDIFNITYLLKKGGNNHNLNSLPWNNKISILSKELISKYIINLSNNRNKLKLIVDKLNSFMQRQKVAFWGAGRIFDALVKYGELKINSTSCLIDKYLSGILTEVHGNQVRKPDFLKIAQPQVVIILARSSSDEIIKEVRKYGIKNVIKFSDLFNSI